MNQATTNSIFNGLPYKLKKNPEFEGIRAWVNSQKKKAKWFIYIILFALVAQIGLLVATGFKSWDSIFLVGSLLFGVVFFIRRQSQFDVSDDEITAFIESRKTSK